MESSGFDFNDPGTDNPSTLKVVVIATIVALIAGCVPALATSLVAVNVVEQESRNRAIENCQRANEGRASNARELQLEIEIERALAEEIPKERITRDILLRSARVKEHELLPKLRERNCAIDLQEAAKNGR